jgi:CHASE2 domain-containing sensor protein
MFSTNVGGTDRGIRIAVGLALIVAAATGTLSAWAWIGVVPLLTGLVGTCPLYSILGIKTCRTV